MLLLLGALVTLSARGYGAKSICIYQISYVSKNSNATPYHNGFSPGTVPPCGPVLPFILPTTLLSGLAWLATRLLFLAQDIINEQALLPYFEPLYWITQLTKSGTNQHGKVLVRVLCFTPGI